MSIYELIEKAIEKGSDTELLIKLVNMKQEEDEKESRKAFFRALSKFQSEVKTVEKKKVGYGYKYAELSEIVETIKDAMTKNGLSYRFEQDQSVAGVLTVTCIISHADGYEQSTVLSSPIGTPKGMTAVQAIGSVVTYLRRYSLTCALGIVTGDEDNDGAQPQQSQQQQVQQAPVQTLTNEQQVRKQELKEYVINSVLPNGVDALKAFYTELEQSNKQDFELACLFKPEIFTLLKQQKVA